MDTHIVQAVALVLVGFRLSVVAQWAVGSVAVALALVPAPHSSDKIYC